MLRNQIKEINKLYLSNSIQIQKVRKILFDDKINEDYEAIKQRIISNPFFLTHLSISLSNMNSSFNFPFEFMVNLQKLSFNSQPTNMFPLNLMQNIHLLQNLKELNLYLSIPQKLEEENSQYKVFEKLIQLEKLETLVIDLVTGQQGLCKSKELYQILSQLNQVKHLRLSLDCETCNNKDEIKIILPYLANLELTTLDLNISRNSQDEQNIQNLQLISFSARITNTLRRLSLQLIYNHYSSNQLENILNGLVVFYQLEEFYILMNIDNIKVNINKILAKILINNKQTLKKVHLLLPYTFKQLSYNSLNQKCRDTFTTLGFDHLQLLEDLEIYTLGNLSQIGIQLSKCQNLKKIKIISDFNNLFEIQSSTILPFFKSLINVNYLLSLILYDEEELTPDIYAFSHQGFKNIFFQFSYDEFIDSYLTSQLKAKMFQQELIHIESKEEDLKTKRFEEIELEDYVSIHERVPQNRNRLNEVDFENKIELEFSDDQLDLLNNSLIDEYFIPQLDENKSLIELNSQYESLQKLMIIFLNHKYTQLLRLLVFQNQIEIELTKLKFNQLGILKLDLF